MKVICNIVCGTQVLLFFVMQTFYQLHTNFREPIINIFHNKTPNGGNWCEVGVKVAATKKNSI